MTGAYSSEDVAACNYALAIGQYDEARRRYRRYSARNRPLAVTEAYISAKRRLEKARGRPNCESPHIQHSHERCSVCLFPCCYGVRVLTPNPSEST